MSGFIYQAATEISVGERDGKVTVTFLRSGDLSSPVNVTYDLTTESAAVGFDFIGASGTIRFEADQSQVSLNFNILNDTLSESTETFVVGIVGVDSGTLSIPRTTRVNILDDENPVLPPVDPPLVSPYRVETETFISGLKQAINFEFSPNNPDIIYVAEKAGLIRAFNIKTGADLGTVVDLRSSVNEYGDRGLMDIAIHPDFANNPYIYAFYVVDPAGSTPDEPGNRYSHVVRFTADASADYLRVVPGSGVVITGQTGRSAADISGSGLVEYTFPEYANATPSDRYLLPNDPNPPMVIDGFKQNYLKVDTLTHAGGSLAFGPDGMLYISTGDGSSPNYADPRATNVQNLNSLNGKILRVDPLTGQGLTDNPFFQQGQSLDSNISKVYQYGLRNPFSIGFDKTGRLFISDTGWKAYEEVNHGGPGANFGWPYYEGREGGQLAQTTGYNTLPTAAAFYAGVANGTIQVTAPYAAFGHAIAVPGFSNQVITGGNVIYDGDKYPAALKNDYFFTNFEAGQTFTIDTNNRQLVNYLFSQSPLAPVHFAQGPDGYVYYADLGNVNDGTINGSIGRIYISDPTVARVGVTATAMVAEGTGTQVQATFTLSAAQATSTAVTYSTNAGTALAGSDFLGVNNATIVIPAGQTSVTASITILGDTVFERNETFQVRLDGAVSGAKTLAAYGGATVYIQDDDPEPAGSNLLVNGSFEATTIPAGSSNYASVPGWTSLSGSRVELWKANKGVLAPVGVNFAELDFDIAQDGFYQDVQTTAGQAHTLTFDLRLRPGIVPSTQTVEILWNGAVVASTLPSANWGSFTASNLIGTGGLDRLTIREVQSQGSDGVGALLDNFKLAVAGPALPSVSVSAVSASVAEASGAQAGVKFTLNAVQANAVTVTYSTVNGTAVAGTDFTGATNATVIIPAGQTSVTAQLPLINDAVSEPTETFLVNLVGATLNGSTIQASGSATITVTDNDPPPAGANLLVNGSFEASAIPIGSSNYASITGWTPLTGSRIELWNANRNVVATNGTNFAELDFDTALDGFYQDVQTVAGQTHTLTFDLRKRADKPLTTPANVEVLWNGSIVARTTPGTNWGSFTVSNLVGTGGLDRLTVRELQSQSADGLGALLDNFQLVAAGVVQPSVTLAWKVKSTKMSLIVCRSIVDSDARFGRGYSQAPRGQCKAASARERLEPGGLRRSCRRSPNLCK
jgi:glucose/arabinose dehydrogenase